MKNRYSIWVLFFLILTAYHASAGTNEKDSQEEASTIVTIDLEYLNEYQTNKCEDYDIDYSKYHTIIHLVKNSPIGTSEPNGKGLNVYEVIESGIDPISGKDRSVGFSIDPSSLISGGGVKLKMRVGEPGTRITFAGDENDPFEPIPGLRLWDGSIDIVPDCGIIIEASGSK